MHANKSNQGSQDPIRVSVDGRTYSLAPRAYYSKGTKRWTNCLYLRLSYSGKQRWVKLGTADPETAKAVANQAIYDLQATKVTAVDRHEATIGQYLAAYRSLGLVAASTYRDYRNKVLHLVSSIVGIQPPHTTRGPRRRRWEIEVGAVKSSCLKDCDFEIWKERQIQICKRDSRCRKSPRTPNGQIAAWRAVFRESSLWRLFGIGTMPGLKIKKLRVKKVVFKLLKPNQSLIELAKSDLKSQDPDCYDLFLLAMACGLRLKEADLLLWSAFDFEREILTVEANTLYGLKTYYSEGEVRISNSEVLDYLKQRYEQRTDVFVLNSDRPAGARKNYNSYRCEPTIVRLRRWLRDKGIKCGKPIHYLRGAGGNQIRIDNDIFAAKSFLRHAQLQTTIEYYCEVDTNYKSSLKF